MATRNFATYFWSKFDSYKDQDAFVFFEEDELKSENYWTWTRRVRALAVGFLDRGFQVQDRVAILCQDRASFFDIAFATWLIGGCVVPIPSGRDRAKTLKRLARAGVSAVILDDFSAYKDLIGESQKIPSLDWIVLEKDPPEPLVSIASIIEKGKFRALRGDLDKLAKRTFETQGHFPALILNTFDDSVFASYFSNTKLVTMMDYLEKTIAWQDERIALQIDLAWFYGLLLGTHALIRGNTLIGGKKASEISRHLDKNEPTIIVAGESYLGSIAQGWRSQVEPNSTDGLGSGKYVSQASGWIKSIGSSVVAAKMGKEVSRDFGKQVKQIYVVDSPVPTPIRDVLSTVKIDVLSMWGRPEIGISHIETSPIEDSLGRPVYGYACKSVGTKSEGVGEIAIRSDAVQSGYWGEEGIAEMGKTWIKFPIEGRIISGDLFLGFANSDPSLDEEE